MGYAKLPGRDAEALWRWERRTQSTLLSLAVLFAVAYAVPIARPEVGDQARLVCTAVEWTVWGAFALDYAIRLRLSPHRLHFVRSHPLALIAVALPLVQPLRLLRLVSALLLAGQRARLASQVQLTVYVGGSCAGLLVFGSLAVLEVERNAPGSSIKTLGDAVWWSFTTMTTVGYGDLAPTTGLGRLLAIGLMLSGIALLGVVTANIAAWFVARVEREDADSERHTAALAALTTEVQTLRAEIATLRGEHTAVPATPDAAAAGRPATRAEAAEA